MTDDKTEARDPDRDAMKKSYDAMKSVEHQGWQKGLIWRAGVMEKIREFEQKKKSIKWMIWYLKTKLGLTEPTARRLVEDALEDEPDQNNGKEK